MPSQFSISLKLVIFIQLFEAINKLIKNEVITGGMLPKIQACLDAINNNVKMAHIVDGRIQHSVLLEIFTNEGIGTLVKKWQNVW